MRVISYPDDESTKAAISDGEPMLVLISFDGETVIMSHADEAVEHAVLLRKVGFRDTEFDRYFRIVLDGEGADWTFVCPPDYKGISDKSKRISKFYKDGFNVISEVLSRLGLFVGISIPKRYRRHIEMI